ncbi:MAG: SDR family oxidoreductase [Leptospiraceae bacterium]|nr:SDR family oxidoreductase [Leptospiraceae bacterium]
MANLTGKKAVITGGNSGIGYSTAKLFKEKGARVIITGRDESRVKKAAEELGVEGIVADASNLKHLDSLSEEVKKKFGTIDILFLNAGVFFGLPIGSNTEEMFDNQMNINFKGAVFTFEKLLPLFIEGTSVISLSTALSDPGSGMANTSIYTASKAALNAYMKIAMTELAPKKIRINTVSPGPIATPIFGKTGMTEEQIKGFGVAMQNRVPLKKFGTPEEVANLVAFLGSDESSFINGAEIPIDGGIRINPGIFA